MSKLIVALDFPALDRALAMAEILKDEVDGFKVGLELLASEGPLAIEQIADLGVPVFADAKLHDIPNTVAGAARGLRDAGARWVTVHASGGMEMMSEATAAMGGRGVLAVTILTSLGPADLATVGLNAGLTPTILLLASLAREADVEGLVCAPGDITAIRDHGVDLEIFTPGVRMEGSQVDDQKRVGTPIAAVGDGANYLVVGRPITRAADPLAAAREITTSIAGFD